MEFVAGDSPSLLSGISEEFTSVSQDLPRPPRRSGGGSKKKKNKKRKSERRSNSSRNPWGDLIGAEQDEHKKPIRTGPAAPVSASQVEELMMRSFGSGTLHAHREESDLDDA
jgi:hypothetical protein